MSSTLALLIFTAFVLFLLWLDYKQTPNVSRALWIPTIWMLSVATKPLGSWFGVGGGGGTAEGSQLDRLFLSFLLCLGLIIIARRKIDWSKAIKQNAWLFLLIFYMLVSILWSDIPFISFKRWLREFIGVVMAFIVLSEQNPRLAVYSILRRTIYILIPFSLLLIKYYQEYGIEWHRWADVRMWVGVTTQKNGLGRLCLIATFFLTWTLVRRWQKRDIPAVKYQTHVEVFVLILTLLLLKGPPGEYAYSATAIGALSVGLVFFVCLLWAKRRRINFRALPLVAMLALSIAFGVATLFVGGSMLGSVSDFLGRNATLTGRTQVWERLLPVAMNRSIEGHGFGGFWTDESRIKYHISEGHSGYLDVLLDIGFLGLLLVSIFLLSSCRRAQKILAYDFDWGSLWICYLLMAVVHNITETSFNNLTHHLTAILLFLSVSSNTSKAQNLRVR